MKTVVLISFCFLFAFSIRAQNGIYNSKRQEYRALNPSENKIVREKCKISIQIFGVGGDDFVAVEIKSANFDENIVRKWKINTEIQMAPDSKGKRIYNSYNASLMGSDEENNNYQITIVKRNKKGHLSVAIIDNSGETNWYYDLEKVK